MGNDLWKYTGFLAGGALLGYSLGATLQITLLVAIGIIVWQTHRVNLIQKWLDKPSEFPMPEMGGLYYQLHKKLTKRNAQYAKRKKQLSNYLSQFRSAVGAMPDAIVLIDRYGKIEWANANSVALLGIRWPEDAGVRFSDLIRAPEVEAMLRNKSSKRESAEINSLTLNNQIINLKSIPYTEFTRMIIARDVSQLIKVNQMHTDFVANVSHELKTPLTVLKGYVEILQNSKDLPEKFIKPLQQMDLQSVRMQLIVNDLLYLAKLEDTANKTPPQPVEVTHLVNAIIESVQPLLEEKRHKIELDVDPNIRILGAQTELHSAFSNLITNAINYTEPQGTIHVHWQSHAGGAMFSVKDNGLGIQPQHINRLTQRFYRVDTDRSREGGGTGLGLAIVKHVLQRHDGELEISSKEGKGSVFSCQFPANKIAIIQASQNTSASRA